MVESSRYRYNCIVDYQVRVTSTDEIVFWISVYALEEVVATNLGALLSRLIQVAAAHLIALLPCYRHRW